MRKLGSQIDHSDAILKNYHQILKLDKDYLSREPQLND